VTLKTNSMFTTLFKKNTPADRSQTTDFSMKISR